MRSQYVPARRTGRRAPEMGADPGQQLGQPEGLDEVVVGARVEAGDDVELLVTRGEDQDGQVRAGVSQSAADVDSVHVRQPEVEHDETHTGVRGGDGSGAAREAADREALGVQDAHEPGGNRVVVLHQQDHASTVSGPRHAIGEV